MPNIGGSNDSVTVSLAEYMWATGVRNVLQ